MADDSLRTTSRPADTPHGDATLNVHLQQLAYLREVDRRGSITRAAEALDISQPALSQALAELERRLGTRLFDRVGRSRSITEEGREVLAFARRVLADADALRRHLEAARRGDEGVLRIGMIDAASLYLLPEAVRRYRATRPSVRLSLFVDTSSQLVARLRAFELDMAIVVGGESVGLEVTELRSEPLHIYAPPRDGRGPDEVEWSLYPAGSRTRALIDEGFARLGIEPTVTLESGNPDVLRQMAAMGLGWAVLPRAVGDRPGAERLRRGRRVAERRIVAVRHADSDDPRAAAFLALAAERRPRARSAAG